MFPRFKRMRIVAGVALVLVVAVGGVGALAYLGRGSDVAASGPTAQRDSGSSTAPPESTLSFDGTTQSGGIGSYCWSADDRARCSDVMGIPVPDAVLTVPAGAQLTFAYGGSTAPSEIYVTASPITGTLHEAAGQTFLQAPGREPQELPAQLSGTGAAITADLPPGGYALSVGIWVPKKTGGTNDVFYGFHVIVE